MIEPVSYFLLILKATLFSFGGYGNLPSIHQDFISRGWGSDQQFGQAMAIGQVAPGPTGLWVVAFGYSIAGFTGAGLGALAVSLPPLLVLPLARVHRRYADAPAMKGFIRGIALAVCGTVPVIIFHIVAGYGLDLGGLAIVAGSVGLVASRRVPLPAVMGLAGVVGYLLYR